jgi:hypothetical protein
LPPSPQDKIGETTPRLPPSFDPSTTNPIREKIDFTTTQLPLQLTMQSTPSSRVDHVEPRKKIKRTVQSIIENEIFSAATHCDPVYFQQPDDREKEHERTIFGVYSTQPSTGYTDLVREAFHLAVPATIKTPIGYLELSPFLSTSKLEAFRSRWHEMRTHQELLRPRLDVILYTPDFRRFKE